MHRRASPRYPAVFNVILYQHGRPVVACRAENVSQDGMFIKAGNLDLPKHSDLEIQFEPPDGEHFKYARLTVTPIHASERGLGLKFEAPKTREQILAHAMLGYANRRFRVYHSNNQPGTAQAV